VVNARDAMPAGGRVRHEARRLGAGDRDGPRGGGEEGSVVVVQDSGTGMSAEVLARAVEPFFTTKGVGKGTGLGLAMVDGFIEQSGGRMKIASRPGEGTTVSLVLPRARGDGRTDRPLPTGVLQLAPPGTVLLVVDDDDQVRPVTTAYLRDLGYVVWEASNGDEALTIAQRVPRLDLLLTDVVMPDMDGPSLASRLRSRHPALLVLFMTGHADPQILVGETVLGKPFSGEDLSVKIHQALGRTLEGFRTA
jgi:CheY-like chemotaxis protein